MIGAQPTGTLPGIVICATSHEGLQVLVDGKPFRPTIEIKVTTCWPQASSCQAPPPSTC